MKLFCLICFKLCALHAASDMQKSHKEWVPFMRGSVDFLKP